MSERSSRGEFIAAGALAAALGLPAAARAQSGVTSFRLVGHGSDPHVARPSATVVCWVGTVRPRRMKPRDIWWNDPKIELAESFPPLE